MNNNEIKFNKIIILLKASINVIEIKINKISNERVINGIKAFDGIALYYKVIDS